MYSEQVTASVHWSYKEVRGIKATPEEEETYKNTVSV